MAEIATQDPKSILHQKLLDAGYDVPKDANEFNTLVADPVNATDIYNELSSQKLYTAGDYNTFATKYGLPLKKKDGTQSSSNGAVAPTNGSSNPSTPNVSVSSQPETPETPGNLVAAPQPQLPFASVENLKQGEQATKNAPVTGFDKYIQDHSKLPYDQFLTQFTKDFPNPTQDQMEKIKEAHDSGALTDIQAMNEATNQATELSRNPLEQSGQSVGEGAVQAGKGVQQMAEAPFQSKPLQSLGIGALKTVAGSLKAGFGILGAVNPEIAGFNIAMEGLTKVANTEAGKSIGLDKANEALFQGASMLKDYLWPNGDAPDWANDAAELGDTLENLAVFAIAHYGYAKGKAIMAKLKEGKPLTQAEDGTTTAGLVQQAHDNPHPQAETSPVVQHLQDKVASYQVALQNPDLPDEVKQVIQNKADATNNILTHIQSTDADQAKVQERLSYQQEDLEVQKEKLTASLDKVPEDIRPTIQDQIDETNKQIKAVKKQIKNPVLGEGQVKIGDHIINTADFDEGSPELGIINDLKGQSVFTKPVSTEPPVSTQPEQSVSTQPLEISTQPLAPAAIAQNLITPAIADVQPIVENYLTDLQKNNPDQFEAISQQLDADPSAKATVIGQAIDAEKSNTQNQLRQMSQTAQINDYVNLVKGEQESRHEAENLMIQSNREKNPAAKNELHEQYNQAQSEADFKKQQLDAFTRQNKGAIDTYNGLQTKLAQIHDMGTRVMSEYPEVGNKIAQTQKDQSSKAQTINNALDFLTIFDPTDKPYFGDKGKERLEKSYYDAASNPEKFMEGLAERQNAGKLSMDQVQAITLDAQKHIMAIKSMPEDYSEDIKRKLTPLLVEKNDLLTQIENEDPSLPSNTKDQLDTVQKQIEGIVGKPKLTMDKAGLMLDGKRAAYKELTDEQKKEADKLKEAEKPKKEKKSPEKPTIKEIADASEGRVIIAKGHNEFKPDMAKVNDAYDRYQEQIKNEETTKEEAVTALKERIAENDKDGDKMRSANNKALLKKIADEQPISEARAIVQDKVKEIKSKRNDLWDDIGKELGTLHTGINPKLIEMGARLLDSFVKEGIYRFADMALEAKEKFGDQVDKILPFLKQAYAHYRMGLPDEELDKYDDEKTVRQFKINQNDTETSADSQQPSGDLRAGDEGQGLAKPVEEVPGQNPVAGSGKSSSESAGSTEETGGSGENASGGERSGKSVNPSGRSSKSGISRNRENGGERNANGEVGENPSSIAGRNHRIEPNDEIVPKGNVAKIKANIEAIKLVKKLEKEDREATPEEKKVLAKFTGWGGLSQVLDENKASQGELPEWYKRNNNFTESEWRAERGDTNWEKNYRKYYDEVKSNLTDDEFQHAVNSTINAHYTERNISDVLWKIAERLGFRGGEAMESSAGIGHIIGLMPKELDDKTHFTAYELESMTGKMLKKLYPDADVHVEGFENAKTKPNSLDLSINNVPFGQTAPYDARYPELSKFNLHNYFIAKNLKLLKPGGIGIFITSDSSMDRTGSMPFRQWATTEGNSDFLGSIRLPNNAFDENAGTQVTTDIMVFKKREGENTHPAAQPFKITVPVGEGKTRDGKTLPISVNEFYKAHPEMMMGEMKLANEVNSGGLYSGDNQTLYRKPGTDIMPDLKKAIDFFPKEEGREGELADRASGESTDLRQNTLTSKDGHIYNVGDDGRLGLWEPEKGTVKIDSKSYPVKTVANDYIGLRDKLNTLLTSELNPEQDPNQIAANREALNKAYDSFTSKYGNLNKNRKLSNLFENESDYPLLTSIEKVKEGYKQNESGKDVRYYDISKGDVFDKQVNFPRTEPTSAETPQDAVNLSINFKGGIDPDYVGKLLGIDAESAKKELLEHNLAYENPKSGLLEAPEEYLSGFVRDKLAEAEAAGKGYEKNVEDLKAIQPKDIPLNQISLRLGSPYIDPKIYERFIKDELEQDRSVAYIPETNTYKINSGGWDKESAKNDKQYSGGGLKGTDLLEHGMNSRTPVIKKVIWEDGKQKEVKDVQATEEAIRAMQTLDAAFQNYVKYNSDAELKKNVESRYNHMMNQYVEPKYSARGVTSFPGMATNYKMRIHQVVGVLRSLRQSLGLWMEVGTGKTSILQAAAMEMRRLGQAKKPMIAVKNATLGDFATKFKQLYPMAKLLVPSGKDMSAEGRNKLFGKIRTGDYDAIVIPHSFLGFIPDRPERVDAYIQERINALKEMLPTEEENKYGSRGDQGEALRNQTVKNEIRKLEKNLSTSPEALAKAEKAKEKSVKDEAKSNLKIEKKINKQVDRRTDNIVPFEDLGIDALFIDEAHDFKKLGFETNMTQGVKGVDTSSSQRALSLNMKTKWIQEQNNGKNVIFATGTPISNTMAEAWTMIKYLRPDILDKYGIKNFDQFATTFGEVVPTMEQTAGGTFKMTNRFSKYVNVPEFQKAWKGAGEVVMSDDVPEFKADNSIPKRNDIHYTLPQSDALKNKIIHFRDILTDWENAPGSYKRENPAVPMVIFGQAKRAAIDLRLIDPSAADDPDSKSNLAVKKIYDSYLKGKDDKLTQMVFADNFQSPPGRDQYLDEDRTILNPAYNKGNRFNLFEDIKQKLIKMGVPEKEIQIIHDHDTIPKKDALVDKFNKGDVRILLGTTDKMGVGINAQERLSDIHHIDAPQRPMDFAQRNGRGIRQGNMNPSVNIHTYGVEKTLDALQYQRLAIKKQFIDTVMRGATEGQRTIVDKGDEDNMGFDEIMAELSGSQTAMLLTKANHELLSEQAQKSSYLAKQVDANHELKTIDSKIHDQEKGIEQVTKSRPEFKQWAELPEKSIQIGNKSYSGDEAVDHLEQYLKDRSQNAITYNTEAPFMLNGKMVDAVVYKTNHPDEMPDINYKVKDDKRYQMMGSAAIRSVDGLLQSIRIQGKKLDVDANDFKSEKERLTKNKETLKNIVKTPYDDSKLNDIKDKIGTINEKLSQETADQEAKDKIRRQESGNVDDEYGDKPDEEYQEPKDNSIDIHQAGMPGADIVKKFYEKDIQPALHGVAEFAKDAVHRVVEAISPQTFASDKVKDILYSGKGYSEMEKAQNFADPVFLGSEKLMGKLDEKSKIQFIDNLKTGKPQATPELQQVDALYRGIDKNAIFEPLKKLNPSIPWKENHFRAIWKKIPISDMKLNAYADQLKEEFPKLTSLHQKEIKEYVVNNLDNFNKKTFQAKLKSILENSSFKRTDPLGLDKITPQQVISMRGDRGTYGRSPFQGSMGEFKMATLVDFSEGLRNGGIPVSYNPAELLRRSFIDAHKYITAQRIMNGLKENDLAKFVKAGDRVPEGMVKLKDKISDVWFHGTEGLVKAGSYYMDKYAAQMLNRYLSNNWFHDTPTGRGLMWYKNFFTSVELGINGFHAINESFEAMASQIGQGLRKIVNLHDVTGGLKDIATSPAAPYTMAKLGHQAIKYLTDKDFMATAGGDKFLKAHPETAMFTKDLFASGGKLAMDDAYRMNSIRAMKEAWNQENYIGAIARALPAINEGFMNQLFDKFIPRLKVGMYFKDHALSLAEHSKELANGQITRETLGRKDWSNVDDRLGELNFDNLWWNNTAKGASQFMFRSMTWKLGNMRALGGGLIEPGREIYSAVKEGRKPKLTPKAANLLAYAFTMATISSIMMKAFTGKNPQTIKDLVAPQVDPENPNIRITPPGSFKDVWHISHNPTTYITSSLSGDMGKMYDMIHNQDFYGYPIYDPDGSVKHKAIRLAEYSAPIPFSIASWNAMKGEPNQLRALGVAGFQKAPQYLNNTPKADDIIQTYNQLYNGNKSWSDKIIKDKKDEIKQLLHDGKTDEAVAKEKEYIQKGILTAKQVKYLTGDLSKSSTPPDVWMFQKLLKEHKNEAIRLYSTMSLDEKSYYDPNGKLKHEKTVDWQQYDSEQENQIGK